MAAGFKKATVNLSLVPSTQTNFPSYVDLSRIGITTLAEAQSVRVFSDESKTTELAREIVSSTEMHVKIASLTNTFTLYVDYDGVRADYAATDTYGRNNVWADYASVYHLNEVSGSRTDSTGNDNLTDVNTVPNATAKIGTNAANFTLANSERLDTTTANVTAGDTPFEVEFWHKTSLTSTYRIPFSLTVATSGVRWFLETQISNTDNFMDVEFGFVNSGNQSISFISSTDTVTDGNYHHYVVKIRNNASKAEIRFYRDGTLVGTATHGSLSYSLPSNFTALTLGAGRNWSTGAYAQYITGDIDEARLRVGSTTSDNYTTTLFNNQNNESSFWGTWSDAGFSVFDSITITESVSVSLTYLVNTFDNINTTESVDSLVNLFLSINDTILSTEDVILGDGSTLFVNISHTIYLTEDISIFAYKNSSQLPANRASGRLGQINMKWGGSI